MTMFSFNFSSLDNKLRFKSIVLFTLVFINTILLIAILYFYYEIRQIKENCVLLEADVSNLSHIYEAMLIQVDRYKILIIDELTQQQTLLYKYRPVYVGMANFFIDSFNNIGSLSSIQLVTLSTSAFLFVGTKLYLGSFGDVNTVVQMSNETLNLFNHFYHGNEFRTVFESCVQGVNFTQVPLPYRYSIVSNDFVQLAKLTKHIFADPMTKKQAINFTFFSLFSPAITMLTKTTYYSFTLIGLRFLLSNAYYASYYEGGNVTTVDVSE